MLKIEDVKVGDELVCIDREGMLCNERLPEAWREYMYKQDKFIVNSIYKNCIVYLDGLKMQITAINGIEKYFKKKEQSQQYTFDDGDYWFDFDYADCQKFPFIALKGATVEQERGINQC